MNKTHVTNKELSKKLAEAGVDVPSEFYWNKEESMQDRWEVVHKSSLEYSVTLRKAYLLSELLEMLPWKFELYGMKHSLYLAKDGKGKWEAYYKYWSPDENGRDREESHGYDKNPANAAAKLLLWLIEQGHIDPNNLNQN